MELNDQRRRIGKRIRELREQEHWNQQKLGEELARVLGRDKPVAGATISRYEEGKRSLKSEMLEALSRVFRVRSSDFYEE